jgi:hypothetical protein
MLALGSLLAALEGREGMPLIGEVVNPGKILKEIAISTGEAVAGSQVAQRFELCEERWQSLSFEGEDVMPAILFAEVEDALAGVEGIAQKNDGKPWEVGLQLRRQSGEGVELAVLFFGVGLGVLDELTPKA